MSLLKQQLEAHHRKLVRALEHLTYSYKKVQGLSNNIADQDEETLETWESFSARFSRVADLFLTKYLRTFILLDDPGFSGSLRDFVNQAEKLHLIENAEKWMAIRELRNITAHEYNEEDLSAFFHQLRETCPFLMNIKEKLPIS